MAFLTEEISINDKAKIDINKMKLTAGIYYAPEPSCWAIDRDRDAFVMFLGGGGPEIPKFYILSLGGQVVVFEANWTGEGNWTTGIQLSCTVSNLRIPVAIEARKEEIKQIIREALEEYCEFGNRRAVTNVTVEFK